MLRQRCRRCDSAVTRASLATTSSPTSIAPSRPVCRAPKNRWVPCLGVLSVGALLGSLVDVPWFDAALRVGFLALFFMSVEFFLL